MKNPILGIIIMLFVLYMIYLIIDMSDMGSANDLKIKYSINESGFMGMAYYTNSYKIDSLGCVSFYNELDSN